jgi:hypothetical protein
MTVVNYLLFNRIIIFIRIFLDLDVIKSLGPCVVLTINAIHYALLPVVLHFFPIINAINMFEDVCFDQFNKF